VHDGLYTTLSYFYCHFAIGFRVPREVAYFVLISALLLLISKYIESPKFVRRIPVFSDLSRTLAYHNMPSLLADTAGEDQQLMSC
jgi:hypothetical protein